MRSLLRWAALLAAGISTAGLVVVGGNGAAVAVPACTVDYVPNQWSDGFTADVTVTNRAAPVSQWELSWTFPGNQAVISGWGAEVRQTGAKVVATSLAWNGSLATGASARFGFQAGYQGANDAPVDFAFNGVSCNEDAPTTTTTTTTTTTGNLPVDCTTATVCDDFEAHSGSTPGAPWTVGAANCTGTGRVSVDSSVAHSGSKSVRVDGKAGYCNHIFFGAPLSGSVVHGRFYVRHTTALPAAHVTFLAMKDTSDNNRDLRMGGQGTKLQWNRESDDATLPEQSPQGLAQSPPLPTGEWNCVRFSLDNGKLTTYLGQQEIAGLKVDGVPTPDIDRQWLNRQGWRPTVTDIRLGWESYGDGSDTLWYDDVAFGPSPIAC
ncbi:cellulose-binding domain-containing protein [Saccharothrix coeruleofusca]|uniref:Hydrolase n=1 Tax=Saccharothrix coeruleofusca TaxID=33919 RepID=A0A918ALH6_9PSEU|nr:cellulose-binding domain-containing protein [Saccharothrix coeruleofusca]MBP2336443.1 hypothetical protein [Saccharothrix coeruleofusca]GGP53089.1 hydrolase [Saccharothrix coeruleofusca]